MRRVLVALAGLMVLLPVMGPSHATADDGDVQRAAEAIADARDRANAATDALFEAESQLDQLQVQQADLQTQIDGLQRDIAKLQTSVETIALNRFARAGTNSMPLITGFRSANEQAQVDVLLAIVHSTSADDFDRLEALGQDLDDAQRSLATNEADVEDAKATLEQRRADIDAEIDHLKDVETEALKDEAVRKALAAEEAERRRIADVEAAAARAVASTTTIATVVQPTSAASGSSGGGVASGGAPATATTPVINEDSSEQQSGSGDSGGGQTGTPGVGARPGGSAAGDFGTGSWVCPVQGSVGFGDTFGQARSGGRLHQGVDMIGDRGLPVVAVVDGFAQSKTNELGGNVIWLTGADGNKYYYAHLDDWATLGAVSAGTVIGYLGQTGNARFSVAHLHFEIHPGGGAAVNPTPTVRAHC